MALLNCAVVSQQSCLCCILPLWLQNRIAGINEVIYCDYGDDIVQRNFKAGTSKFRQVKLYSTNFSFSTDEIIKSAAN
jgi:hypothetical protein